jgi:TonB family protein
MSRAFHINPFDLLGQTELYTYPVHLPGKVEPKLEIAWKSFHNTFIVSGIPAFFQRASIDKDAPPSKIFPDLNIERRMPYLGLLAAALWHVVFIVIPWPDFMAVPPPNRALENSEITWSGPINDLPLLQIPKNQQKSSPRTDPAPTVVTESTEAFHPRQRIYTDPVHPNHPRQTLINPAAPAEAPKFLPAMPNVVEIASSQAPARPRMEISENTLAKLHPKAAKSATTTDAPTPELANLEQHTAALSIATSTSGPAKPKLQINPSSAPRVAERTQTGDNGGAPDVPLPGAANSSAPSTLIALSANPAPPGPVIPVPQGNLAARVAISPEGKPGASGASPSGTAGAGNGGSGTGNSSGGTGNNSVGISISGGNPKPNANASGLGGAGGKLTLPKSQSMMTRPDPNAAAEDPPERTGPPDFSILAPGAKPEQIFSTKHVYTMNVNMPNLNSATGSWIIHFSELHLPDPAHRSGTVSSPVPLHKVDPKYPQDLVNEHVEGEVILYGVIRRDGTVDSIQKVRGIDPQLDANSIEAFAQWKFQPATRDGEPVDLEAVVHIPFKAPERIREN